MRNGGEIEQSGLIATESTEEHGKIKNKKNIIVISGMKYTNNVKGKVCVQMRFSFEWSTMRIIIEAWL